MRSYIIDTIQNIYVCLHGNSSGVSCPSARWWCIGR